MWSCALLDWVFGLSSVFLRLGVFLCVVLRDFVFFLEFGISDCRGFREFGISAIRGFREFGISVFRGFREFGISVLSASL